MIENASIVAQPLDLAESNLAHFREILPQEDREALDELFEASRSSKLASVQTANTSPIVLALLMMLLEEHRTIRFLIDRLDYYDQKLYIKRVLRPPNQEARP